MAEDTSNDKGEACFIAPGAQGTRTAHEEKRQPVEKERAEMPQQAPQAQQQQQMPQYVQIGPGGLTGTQAPMLDRRGYAAPGGAQQFMVMMRDQIQQFMTTMSTMANALGANPAGPARGSASTMSGIPGSFGSGPD